MPSRGMRWRRTRCLGGRLRRGLLSPASSRMRRSVVRLMSMPSPFVEQFAQMGVVGPCVHGTSQTHYTGHRGLVGLRWLACGPDGHERWRQRSSWDGYFLAIISFQFAQIQMRQPWKPSPLCCAFQAFRVIDRNRNGIARQRFLYRDRIYGGGSPFGRMPDHISST